VREFFKKFLDISKPASCEKVRNNENRVWVPSLPGCASQGETEAEAPENIRDAIRD